jgi:hypothetical protein
MGCQNAKLFLRGPLAKLLTDFLLQSLEVYQIFFVSLMDLAGGFVGCGRFCAD